MGYIYFACVLLCKRDNFYFKKDAYKKILIGISIGIIILFTWRIHPYFILFLPLNLYEIVSYYIEKKWPLFFIMIIPIVFTDESVRMTYGLIAAFCFLVLTMAIFT